MEEKVVASAVDRVERRLSVYRSIDCGARSKGEKAVAPVPLEDRRLSVGRSTEESDKLITESRRWLSANNFLADSPITQLFYKFKTTIGLNSVPF